MALAPAIGINRHFFAVGLPVNETMFLGADTSPPLNIQRRGADMAVLRSDQEGRKCLSSWMLGTSLLLGVLGFLYLLGSQVPCTPVLHDLIELKCLESPAPFWPAVASGVSVFFVFLMILLLTHLLSSFFFFFCVVVADCFCAPRLPFVAFHQSPLDDSVFSSPPREKWYSVFLNALLSCNFSGPQMPTLSTSWKVFLVVLRILHFLSLAVLCLFTGRWISQRQRHPVHPDSAESLLVGLLVLWFGLLILVMSSFVLALIFRVIHHCLYRVSSSSTNPLSDNSAELLPL